MQEVNVVTKVNYIKCLNELKAIRERIRGDYKTIAELSKDGVASEAYKMTIQLEAALNKLAPGED